MKSKLFLLLLIILGSAFGKECIASTEIDSQVNQQFAYFSSGLGPLPIPLPVFALGYNVQRGHHGADLSLQGVTIVSVTQLKANMLYHYYFKPCHASQFYAGGGLGTSILLNTHDKSQLLVSPEFVFGKQYRNETNDLRFVQMQISFPTLTFRHHKYRAFAFPLAVISYGMAF